MQGLLCYLAGLDVKKSGITIGQLFPRYVLPEISGGDFAKLKFPQDGSSLGLHQGSQLSLPAGLSSVKIHFLSSSLVFVGAGTGPLSKVERSSSSDKCQALGKDQD